MKAIKILPYQTKYRDRVLELVIDTWEPVFKKTEYDVPRFVYDNFYPKGWKSRQVDDVSALLDSEPESFWLAFQKELLVGFVGIAIHPEDKMGEISIIAVSPSHQRQGIIKALMDFSEEKICASGMKMVMVETVGDSGHEPARRTYEFQGYEQWPVARYFKAL
ncbi:GNAT family N-acetyltransferase [Pleionea sediminis]|uniref:GNAT family N-acetyltransferase n=1 Tax=Pleionea sediminis TaxID=2569479 RepID=UPI0011859085|nr:GNAT family N-acetyltransferase [Pleionea sediminis]